MVKVSLLALAATLLVPVFSSPAPKPVPVPAPVPDAEAGPSPEVMPNPVPFPYPEGFPEAVALAYPEGLPKAFDDPEFINSQHARSHDKRNLDWLWDWKCKMGWTWFCKSTSECKWGWTKCGSSCMDPWFKVCVSGIPRPKKKEWLWWKREGVCPPGLEACNVPFGKGFECIDTSSNLEACGGCPGTQGSVDCTAIPGVQAVNCIKGRCVASSFKGQQ